MNDITRCPSCGFASIVRYGDELTCRNCRCRSYVYIGHPRPRQASAAEAAGIEDAECANHPGKKAVAVCAGTGDFICSLCRVELNGVDYSVQYLDRGGAEVAAKAFAKTLPRPDRYIRNLALFSILFYLLSPILFVVSCFSLRKHIRQRRADTLYRTVCGVVWPWLWWSMHLLFALSLVLLFLGIGVGIWQAIVKEL